MNSHTLLIKLFEEFYALSLPHVPFPKLLVPSWTEATGTGTSSAQHWLCLSASCFSSMMPRCGKSTDPITTPWMLATRVGKLMSVEPLLTTGRQQGLWGWDPEVEMLWKLLMKYFGFSDSRLQESPTPISCWLSLGPLSLPEPLHPAALDQCLNELSALKPSASGNPGWETRGSVSTGYKR